MVRERILITVKTYPTLSKSHIELVCTAGFREDGSWIRIYPIPFRLLEKDIQFPKWTWVELPLIRRHKDKRPESFSPTDRNDISIEETISTSDDWHERRKFLFKNGPAETNLTKLIEAAKRNEVSLATFKPKKMLSFEWEKTNPTWDDKKLAAIETQLRQIDFLEPNSIREDFKPANKLPYNFYYNFEDKNGRKSRMRILDWEIGMLYWNCLKRAKGNEEIALEKVRQMYEENFFQKDLHLFLGTTLEWHDRAPNPWMIIGVVPIPPKTQLDLF